MNSVRWVPLQIIGVQNTSEASPYILGRLLPPFSARAAFQILTLVGLITVHL